MKTSVFKALSDPIRRHILLELKKAVLMPVNWRKCFKLVPKHCPTI